jgi:hypothetical protein
VFVKSVYACVFVRALRVRVHGVHTPSPQNTLYGSESTTSVAQQCYFEQWEAELKIAAVSLMGRL